MGARPVYGNVLMIKALVFFTNAFLDGIDEILLRWKIKRIVCQSNKKAR